MKKPHPIKFRAIHTKNRWRKSDHETLGNALGKTRGARALFDYLNKAINYSVEGEPKFVIVWHEDADEGEIVKPDHDQWDGLLHARIGIKDIEIFERDGPPGDEELERYFRPPTRAQMPMFPSTQSAPQDEAAETSSLAELELDLQRRIELSRQLSATARQSRLRSRAPLPRRIDVHTSAFIRSADVIVEVLERAQGVCEECNQPAPFLRARDGTPYLEVHHRVPLAADGEDTVENAVALCPNCHRFRHYGNAT